MNYLIAVNVATIFSTIVNLFVNFFWVWGNKKNTISKNDNENDLRPYYRSLELVKYTNEFFKVEYVNAKFKNFTKDYYIVNFGERVGAVIVKNNLILLVGQYRLLLNELSWEIPGGSVNKGETPEAAIIRECNEETGYKIKILQKLIIYYPGLDNVNNKTTIFLVSADNLDIEFSTLDQSEIECCKWVPMIRCVELIMNKEIKDALTITGILAYKCSSK
jgi:8-oxo-dGTP pyrophosphatase MutT (NUDIX family)